MGHFTVPPGCATGGSRTVADVRILVTGGARSGKSTHAERLVSDAATVTYVAPWPLPDLIRDPEWAARVLAHQSRRPEHWTTVETPEVASVVASAEGAVLVDCVGTWLTSLIDDVNGWKRPEGDWLPQLREQVAVAVQAVELHVDDVVLVTNEVGFGLVPEYRSGRVFRDLLGWTNQQFAAACDEVHLVVAGRVLVL